MRPHHRRSRPAAPIRITIERRPPGDGPLAVEIAVRHATTTVTPDGLDFRADRTGRRLRFDELHTVDARGTLLASHFEPSGTGFRIVVDDDAASYPIVIDPLLTESHDTDLVGAQSSAYLGVSAASAGDVNGDGFSDVIVSAPGHTAGGTPADQNEGLALVFLGGAIDDGTAGRSIALRQLR